MSNNSLRHDFISMCVHNRDGSHATQAARRAVLKMAAQQLQRDLGFRNLRAERLGQRHLVALVKHWQANNLSIGTIKNRIAHLRWAAEKAGKPGVAGISNTDLGIEQRSYVAKESKAISLPDAKLGKIADPHIRMSLRLQRAFGLRREESLKINVSRAWQGDSLKLEGSWCKGGRIRDIPIRTAEQRQVLTEARELAGHGSMIPAERSYIQHLKMYENQLSAAGISRAHGLRHAYAQQRYEQLTGRPAPVALATALDTHAGAANDDGAALSTDSPTTKFTDAQARLLISAELGHSRAQITTVYIGR